MFDTFQLFLDDEKDFHTTNVDFFTKNDDSDAKDKDHDVIENNEKMGRKDLKDQEKDEEQNFNSGEERNFVFCFPKYFKLKSDVTCEIEINYQNDILNSVDNVNSFFMPINIQKKNFPKKVNFSENIIRTKKLLELMKDKKREKSLFIFTEFLKWFLIWIEDERDFCQYHINNIDAWNYEINRVMSFRYFSFLLFRAINYLSSCASEFEKKKHEKKQEIKRQTDFDEEIKTNFLKQNIFCDEFIVEHLRSFLLCLKKSFSLISIQLVQEGTLNLFLSFSSNLFLW